MNAHQSKLLFQPATCPSVCFWSINRLRLDSSPPQFLNDLFCAKFEFFSMFFIRTPNLNLQSHSKYVKWQIQEGYMIISLPYWTGGGVEQVAPWFLPPTVSLGLKLWFGCRYLQWRSRGLHGSTKCATSFWIFFLKFWLLVDWHALELEGCITSHKYIQWVIAASFVKSLAALLKYFKVNSNFIFHL